MKSLIVAFFFISIFFPERSTKRAMTTGKPLVLPNGSTIAKSAEFVQAAMDTEILDGISRFAIEQILRSLLIQNVKAANPSLYKYNIDLYKALGL